MEHNRSSNRKTIVAASVTGVTVALAIVLAMIAHHTAYAPTTLTNVPHAKNLVMCSQTSDNPNLPVDAANKTFIENAVASSIIDVPAGTTVDVHFKSYNSKTASGTAVYSGKYGSYNFTASKTASNASNNYVGGWKITHLETCKG